MLPELKGKLDGSAVRVPVPDGSLVDLTFTPFHLKESVIDLTVFAGRTHQCFGHWVGRVRDESGAWIRIADAVGWAEDVHNRW